MGVVHRISFSITTTVIACLDRTPILHRVQPGPVVIFEVWAAGRERDGGLAFPRGEAPRGKTCPRPSCLPENLPPSTVRTNGMPRRKGSPVDAHPYICWVVHDPVSAILPIRSRSSRTSTRVADECTPSTSGRKRYGPIQT